MNANLFALLSDNIADPAATAIETAAGERISYADLVARTGRMANALAGLGVKPGDRVAAQVEKSVEAIVLYLGTVRAGGVFLPLNTGYTPAEIEYFLGDAEPAVFVCDPGQARGAAGRRGQGGRDARHARRQGQGQPDGRGRRGSGSLRDGGARGRRPRGAALHLGHHRPLQGRDADPRQPRLERRGAARGLGLHRRRRADPRAADLPHPRPLRRDQRHAVLRRLDDLPAEVRRRPDLRADAAGDRADGRPDLLRPPARGRDAERRDDRAHAGVHCGLRAAARRDPSRVAGEDRPRHPRALRHDRDQHERLEPLRRRPRGRHRRPAAARGRDHRHRPGDRRRARPGRGRHDRGARPERLQGLLADAGEDRRRAPRERLLHHRRPRQDRRAAATSTSSAAART